MLIYACMLFSRVCLYPCSGVSLFFSLFHIIQYYHSIGRAVLGTYSPSQCEFIVMHTNGTNAFTTTERTDAGR
ncbi:hypothetical protein BJ138DRAFT_1156575 [Hygrophoropsis aurantiaca]|uniref:Uncharacterized protein n=1 Tax=Hygrophoropsis aurantiaca TaxID=72124 RepID=A0ACB8A714_9AGAM|nr:hypothetical protein BJ138DRAFT_1156575 [Hygrophoropsis aurantiaca]